MSFWGFRGALLAFLVINAYNGRLAYRARYFVKLT